MSEVQEIAGKLSPAQKRAVTWPSKSEPTMVWCYDRTMVILERFDLIADRRGGWATLSSLGSAVRAHLQATQGEK